MVVSDISILTSSAVELQRRLKDGSLTSVKVVEAYLDQIERHNKKGLHLNAIISAIAREAVLSTARKLDQERSRGNLRSRLHGIPIIIKVQHLGRVLVQRLDCG